MPTLRFPILAFVAAMLLASLAAAQEQDPLAAPKSMNQVGFPALLYLWVISPDNP